MSPRSRGPGAYVRRIAGTGPPRPITGPIAAAGIGPIHDVPVRSAPHKRGKGVLTRGEGGKHSTRARDLKFRVPTFPIWELGLYREPE